MLYLLRLNKLLVIAFVSIIAFIILHVHLFNVYQVSGSDNLENLAGAYSIAKYNTFAVYSSDEKLHPSAIREPLYPFIFGMVLKARNVFSDKVNDNFPQTLGSFYRGIYSFLDQPEQTTNRWLAKKGVPCFINVSFLFMAIFISCIFIYFNTKNAYLVLYAAMTLVFSSALAESAHTFLTEILSALLCTLVSILLFYSKEHFHKKYYGFFIASAISALVLTKAIYLYFIPIIFIYLIVTNLQKIKNRDKGFLLNAGIFVLSLVILTGGWMLRNYVNFSSFFIADRKAVVLMYRAEYDSISQNEYPYLYALWAPGLSKYFLSPNTEPYWSRLVNYTGNERLITEAYQKIYTPFFMEKKMSIVGAYGQPDSDNQAGYHQLEKKSIHKIKAHPLGHLKLTLAFLYRSFFVEDGAGLRYLGFNLPYEDNAEKRVDSFLLALLINLPIWFCFFYMMINSIRTRNAAYFTLTLIPSYTVIVYSFVAFSHPRYMQPMIPLLTIIFCLSWKKIFEESNKKLSVPIFEPVVR